MCRVGRCSTGRRVSSRGVSCAFQSTHYQGAPVPNVIVDELLVEVRPGAARAPGRFQALAPGPEPQGVSGGLLREVGCPSEEFVGLQVADAIQPQQEALANL